MNDTFPPEQPRPDDPTPDEPLMPVHAPDDAPDAGAASGAPVLAGDVAEYENHRRTRVVFEDLTLGQALAYLFWQPVRTSRLFWDVLTRDPLDDEAHEAPEDDQPPGEDGADGRAADPITHDVWGWGARSRAAAEPGGAVSDDVDHDMADGDQPRAAWARRAVQPPVGWALALAIALLLAAQGGYALREASENIVLHARRDTNGALLWIALAGGLYLAVSIAASRGWWVRRLPRFAATVQARMIRNGPDMRRVWVIGLGFLALAFACVALLAGGAWWLRLIGAGIALALWIVIVIGSGSPIRTVGPAAQTSEPVTSAAPPDDARTEDAGSVHVVRSVRVEGAAAAAPAAAHFSFWVWLRAHTPQLALVPFALLLSVLAYWLNVTREGDVIADVVLTLPGVIAWVGSVALWWVILGVDLSAVPTRAAWTKRWRQARRRAIRWRPGWDVLALAGITAVGIVFRLHDLASTPPEMTSDHIEKLLDALRVSEGYYGVFFPNNGGREGFQMYLVALIADVFGVGFNFTALKIATAIEGAITIPVMWWMVRAIAGRETPGARRLGTWVGLAAAALVAISAWHVMLSRLGLRIVLTPLTTALALGFLAQAMRHNRMRDYLALGVVLGAGTYFYQANRMLPLVAVAGIALAMIGQARRPREWGALVVQTVGLAAFALAPVLIYWYAAELLQQSGGTRALGERLAIYVPLVAMTWFAISALAVRATQERFARYGAGLLASAVLALAIFVPMLHYSELHATEFWNRTRGRMFGEEAFVRLDPESGQMLPYNPPLSEQLERLWDERDVFLANYADALRMYHWQGDGAWINNAGSAPALDALTGGWLLLGAIMWGVRMVRRRDPVDWLIPLAVLVMLLPSALTLAYTIENPSFTRASGTIPPIFLLAGLPVGTLGWRLSQLDRRGTRRVFGSAAGLLLIAGVTLVTVGPNWDRYFTDYRLNYNSSWKPYSAIARPLREFAQGEGSYGNAFMVAYPHWLDHRILGTMAGDIRWPNGLVTREDLWAQVDRNRGTPYAYDPSQPLFVMYHPDDIETHDWLQTQFPGGEARLITYRYETLNGVREGTFYVYEVMAGPLE